MKKKQTVSFRFLAGLENPFQDKSIKSVVEKRLLKEKSESRLLEWKLHGPFASEVTKGGKYRIVKAIISFANTVGGFIVFGVNSEGKWIGLNKEEMNEFDPAKITELVNGCVTPDITEFNIYFFPLRKKHFIVLHIPPSKLMPHVTTKEVIEKIEGRKPRTVLVKHMVYCRFGGKTDLARPADYQRIIWRRTDVLREELLRRFKELTVGKASPIKFGGKGHGVLVRVAESTKDSSMPVVKLTRKVEGTRGMLLHEALSEGLFDEINNVLDANKLLAKGSNKFVLGLEVYYRIYAEREHVEPSNERIELLAQMGVRFYAPVLYWLLQLPHNRLAEIIREACKDPKASRIYSIMRLAILLGRDVSMWVGDRFDEKWAGERQPPDYYVAFKKMQSSRLKDRRLVALRTKEESRIEFPGEEKRILINDFLECPEKALSFLSRYCVRVFEGRKKEKSICRCLDVLCYGQEFESHGDKIMHALIEENCS